MQIDWGTAGATAAIALVALIGGMYALSGRHEERILNLKERTDEILDDHDQRIKEVTDKVTDLPNRYISRAEMDEKLEAIRRSQDKTEKLLNWLVFFGRRQAGMSSTPPPPPLD